jgi:signal transduction histidine kinase
VLDVVAHDLRNPLSTILMQNAALSRRGAEPERRNQKPSEVILRAARRMSRLIQDLLDVSVIEARHLSIERAPVPTGQLVLEAVEAAPAGVVGVAGGRAGPGARSAGRAGRP